MEKQETFKSFYPLFSSKATSELTAVNDEKAKINPLAGRADIHSGGIAISIEHYSEFFGIKTSTLKLLDILTIELTERNKLGSVGNAVREITVPIEKYMSLCKVHSSKPLRDKARRTIAQDLNALSLISLQWSERIGKEKRSFSNVRLCDEAYMTRGIIHFTFSEAIMEYLVRSYVMQYPSALLGTDGRNPNTYPLGRKLSLHNSMTSNVKRGTANLISVSSLLKSCPFIPSRDEVSKRGRRLTQQIRVPFEKALNSIDYIEWHYSLKKAVL